MSKKQKTVVIQDKPRPNPEPSRPISIDQYVKALENTLSLPLQENMNFHQIVILAEEKNYKQPLIDSCIYFKLTTSIFFLSFANTFEAFLYEKSKL